MTDSLGLSIGMTNLVAARVGNPPVTRRAVLNLFRNRAPEVGIPSENPSLTEPGLVLSGFVERVGDPVPIVAADGSSHQADRLLVEALDAMVRTVSTVNGATAPSNIAIAVPAYWGPAAVGALRSTLRVKPNLSPNGIPAPLIPDSVAALAALQTSPGLPDSGIVALLDFGGSGTSITLADAATELLPIDETSRYTEFSGELIDQALVTHVLADIKQSGETDASGTTDVGALSNLREQARLAKERLSAQTATELPVELPGYHSDIRVTRSELEQLIRQPLAGVIAALEQVLERNRVQIANLSAVATVGGGAAIPLITQRLSEHFRVQVVTTPQPALNIAAGAAVVADRGMVGDAPTGLAAASDTPTGMSTAAWAAGAAGVAATESASDGASSATFRALAWSQEDGTGAEPVPYTGADYNYEPPTGTGARPQMEFLPPDEPPLPAEEPLPWYRRPPLIFAAAATVLLIATGGLIYTLTTGSLGIGDRSQIRTSTAVTNPVSPGVPLTETVTVTGTDGSPTVVTPPPPSSAPTTSSPHTTTTTSAPTTTTTTTSPTTTTTTTTQPTTTTTRPTTTTQPPTTTTKPPPTTTAAPTTTADIPTTTFEPPTVTTVDDGS